MRLSSTVNLYTVRREGNDPRMMIDAIDVLKDAGYDALDFFLGPVQDEDVPFQDKWVADAVREMERKDIRASQAHSYLTNMRQFDDEAIEAFKEKIVRGIHLASRLGVPSLVIHPLCLTESRMISYEESLEKNVAFFRSFEEVLEKNHVVCAIENIAFSEYDNADSLLTLFERIDCPSLFGFCWDTGHANLSVKARDCQAESIMKFGNRLKCTHIQDNHGQKDEHILPMMGNIAWKPIVDALKTSGYAGDFTYESAQNVKYLPDDDILRKEMIRYTVRLGRYLLEM